MNIMDRIIREVWCVMEDDMSEVEGSLREFFENDDRDLDFLYEQFDEKERNYIDDCEVSLNLIYDVLWRRHLMGIEE